MKQGKQQTILWIGLVVLISILFLNVSASKEGFQVPAVSGIPKVIWTYWNKTELPPVIALCIDSWRRTNPEYKVTVVTKESLPTYLPDLNLASIAWNDSPARESDIVRLNLLKKYGGYWADASTLMTGPIPFQGGPGTEFAGYYLEGFTTDMDYPVIESWFFGTVAGGKFITAWLEAFMDLSSCESVDTCVERALLAGVDLQNISSGLRNYLYIHVAAQYALQKVMTVNEIKTGMVFLKAEDGPYKYLNANSWKEEAAVESLCRGENRTPIVKFRSHERAILEKGFDKYKSCIFTRSD